MTGGGRVRKPGYCKNTSDLVSPEIIVLNPWLGYSATLGINRIFNSDKESCRSSPKPASVCLEPQGLGDNIFERSWPARTRGLSAAILLSL